MLQGELKEALKGLPVGLPSKAKVKAKAKVKKQQSEAVREPEPETQKKGFLDGICETVLERLGPCTRGADGGPCELEHPPDCTKPACHAKGGRKATGCKGWHLFMKHSELMMMMYQCLYFRLNVTKSMHCSTAAAPAWGLHV